MRVGFHRLADEEFLRTARRLGRQGRAKRVRFVTAVNEAVDLIAANPAIGSPIYGIYRWVKAGRFSYILYYGLRPGGVAKVFAVAHASRRPGYWLRRTTRP